MVLDRKLLLYSKVAVNKLELFKVCITLVFLSLQIKNFKDYVDLYLKDKVDDADNPVKAVYENVNDRWEVAVALSDKGFQQMSFVNSIATTKVCTNYLHGFLMFTNNSSVALLNCLLCWRKTVDTL